MKNKKGISTIAYFFLVIVLLFVFSIIFGLGIYASNQVNTALMSVEGDVGSVNFQNATAATWGQMNSGLNNSANLIGAGLMFAMFIGMLINAFLTRGENVKIFIIVDIVILLVAFLFSTYISNAYEEIIQISDLSTTFQQTMNMGSSFMLNLPLYVLIFGILIMVISYSGIPASREEQVAGY